MIKINRSSFLQALALARDVAKSGSALPILSCVHLWADGKYLEVRSTNLDVNLNVVLPLDVEGKLSVVVPVVKLSCFLAVCDGADVRLSPVKNFLEVECGLARCSLNGLDPDEFPKPNEDKAETALVFGPNELLVLLETVFCASKDETRYILNGLLFCSKGGEHPLNVVATDGKRLAVRNDSRGFPDEVSAVIPVGGVKTIASALRSKLCAPEVDFGFSDHMFHLSAGAISLSGKLIEGQFPNWEQVVPEDSAGIAFSPPRLLEAVERARVICQDSLKLSLKDGRVNAFGRHVEMGESEDWFDLDMGSSPEVVAHLNPEFLVAGLKWCGSSPAEIVARSSTEAVVLKSYAGGLARYVLMPMRVEE